jgi:hypothetical protein
MGTPNFQMGLTPRVNPVKPLQSYTRRQIAVLLVLKGTDKYK